MIVVPCMVITCTGLFAIEKVNYVVSRNFVSNSTYTSDWCRRIILKLMIQYFQYSGTVSLYELQMPYLATIFSLLILLTLFYFGQKVHTNLLELSDVIYQLEWYRYSPRVRRFMLLMLLRAQQPFYLSAYGIMALNLENYVGVSEWWKWKEIHKWNSSMLSYSLAGAQMDLFSVHVVADSWLNVLAN